MWDQWVQRVRDRPVLVAACTGALLGVVGGGVPLRLALLLTRDGRGEFSCQSEYPMDCLFPNAFEVLPLLFQILFALAAVMLGFVTGGGVLLAVSGARLRMSRRAGAPAKRVDRVVLATGVALLVSATTAVATFFV